MHIACANKQPEYQCHAENDDKFGSDWVRLKGQQGAFTPRFGLYLALAGRSRLDLKSGNYQVSHHFSTFYYTCCTLNPTHNTEHIL